MHKFYLNQNFFSFLLVPSLPHSLRNSPTRHPDYRSSPPPVVFPQSHTENHRFLFLHVEWVIFVTKKKRFDANLHVEGEKKVQSQVQY